MNAQSIILLYESIADLTGQMLNAARANDWDKLVEVESHCATYVAKSQECNDAMLTMTGADREHQVALIQQILQDNQEIRTLIEADMLSLSNVIKNTSNEIKLAKTYNINPGG